MVIHKDNHDFTGIMRSIMVV